MGKETDDSVNISKSSDSENGVPHDLSPDALQLAGLGHKEELGMIEQSS